MSEPKKGQYGWLPDDWPKGYVPLPWRIGFLSADSEQEARDALARVYPKASDIQVGPTEDDEMWGFSLRLEPSES